MATRRKKKRKNQGKSQKGSETMIMGIDHGYYAIKTRHFKFPAGVAVYSHEPYTLKNTLQVNGKYYVCGTGRQPILRDKTINDNYYILTLAAIAMELRYRGLPAESSVTLAAGLPLARYGRDKKPFTEYLLRNGQPVTFRFEGERYKIKIEDVKLFPQGYSAIAVRPDLVKNEPSILLTIEGNGDGNGQVPPGQHEDEDGTIVNPGGNVAPGLNRGEKIDKPANPNKPEKPNKPGSEDKEDKKVNKAQQGTHIYTYDELNRMVTSDVSKVFTNYTYDTLGNLVLETVKNKSVDYEYNELNQLVKRTTTQNETFTYSYDKRGNRVAETGKKESREYVYDATNRLVEGTNWKGDKSAYTYNGLGLRVNNLVPTHAGKTYDRDYVIDYTSPENDDLYVYAMGNGQLEYEQRHVYAGSERLEQITEKGTGGWERTLYVHEDVMGNTRYYTKATGQNFAELQYDAWGQPVSPNKLVNNDHGNYVFATFTGHIYDTTIDVYFAEARFYDAITRTWMAMDPIKSGLNWYSYVAANPITYVDWTGMYYITAQEDNGEFIVEVHKENETVMGMLGAANEIIPLVNMTYNFIKAQNGAIIGSTYNGDTLAESSITAAEDELISETLEEIATDILKISEKTVSYANIAITAGESLAGYINGTLSVKNEDILFELIENSEYNDIMKMTLKDAETAEDDALAIHNKLQLGLMLIEENDIYFNQNLAEYEYAKVPSAYEVSKEIEEINRRYKDPQVAEVKINQLVNGYARTYREALLVYLQTGGLQEGEWKDIFEKYQDDYTVMGEKMNELVEEWVQSFKQSLVQSPAITQELQRYFDKLIGSYDSMLA